MTNTNGTLAVGVVNTVVDTSSPVTVSTTLPAEFHFNENAAAATAVTYNLPTAAAGKQVCVSNAYNGSAANTGVFTVNTSAAGQYIIDVDGTRGSTGGHITSGGAGGCHLLCGCGRNRLESLPNQRHLDEELECVNYSQLSQFTCSCLARVALTCGRNRSSRQSSACSCERRQYIY